MQKEIKYSELRLDKVEKLSGEEMQKRFKTIYNILENVDRPMFFTGLPGTGKTVLAKALAKLYCKRRKCKAYYLQLSPDMTKTSIILGLRLENGNLVPYKGVVAEAIKNGDIVVVDEATHTTQQLLLMFNSLLDRESSTSIGDEIIYKHDNARIIFCSNDSKCAGNVQVPQSFAQRCLFFNFEYPDFIDEKKIVRNMLKTDIDNIDIPEGVISYVRNIVADVRNESFPLSVRNIANALVILELTKKNEYEREEIQNKIEEILGEKGEAKVKNIYQLIHGQEENDIEKISEDDYTNDLLSYIVSVGHEVFRESILSACMYYADIDGFTNIEKTKDKLKASIL